MLGLVLYLSLTFIVAWFVYLLRYRWYKRHSNLSDFGIRETLDFGDCLIWSYVGLTIIMISIGVVMAIFEYWDTPV